MTDSTQPLIDPFIRGLACAALSPSLRRILVFNAQPEALLAASATLGQMLTALTGREVETIRLGTTETDDDLWGSLTFWKSQPALPGQPPVLHLKPQSGLLTSGHGNGPLLLVLIPDLTRLSLAAARACTILVGADIAHLERHGQHEQWMPDICWLAGCRREQVGRVSPHLLDRFALRLHGAPPSETNRLKALVDWLRQREESPSDVATSGIDQVIKQQLHAADQRWATMTAAALARIPRYMPLGESARRAIALARLAQADARLKGNAEVTIAHVDEAAQLIGLELSAKAGSETGNQKKKPPAGSDAPAEAVETTPQYHTSASKNSGPAPITRDEEPHYKSPDEPMRLDSLSLSLPYPEDDAPVEREATPLRLPWLNRQAKRVARGRAIGIEQATDWHDLSVMGTLLTAAKFQTIRRQPCGVGVGKEEFLLSPSDLRRYRRMPLPEYMFVLVLDYTCLNGVQWEEALLPYLRWAYIKRATICLIQVGVAVAQKEKESQAVAHPAELRAKRLMAQSILVPHIDAAWETQAGRATPLAHGLEQAYQTLRHALQHGRHTVQQAWLVVLTDGRGNVSLEASQLGKITAPVYRRGVDDALTVAERIQRLDGVEVTLLNPQPHPYAQLPLELAEALGAMVEQIPSNEDEDEDEYEYEARNDE